MKQQGIRHPRLNILAAGCMALVLSACGGGGFDTSTSSIEPAQVDEIVLSGSVGDGPIVGATISVYAANGKLISTFTSDSYAKYSIDLKIPKGSYPLLVEAKNGVDLVTGSAPDFSLISVVKDSSDEQVNLNPFSTLIVEIAKNMPGGLKSSNNLSTAMDAVMTKMNYGLDLTGIQNPINTTIDETNIANIVKASEALGEMIRRTRDTLSGSGYINSGNDVVRALAADLVDGSLDGRGASDANARISAVASLVTGQVAIEAMRNTLHVNGVNATSTLDSAIKTTLPTTTDSSLTNSVRINAEILAQAKSSISAASAIAPSQLLATLSATIASITPGSSSTSVSQILPSDSSSNITQAISLAASGSDSDIATINTTINSDAVASQENRAPTISGSPATSASAGSAYSFQPTAGDADAGTTLSFSISNRPSWASFSSTTGRLSGTPTNANVGTTSGIIISVSDGIASTSLPAFSLTVNSINTAPTISGSPATSVNAGNAYSFQPTASDADPGTTLSFSISNRPNWASFSSTTGRLSGTPTNANAGSTKGIVISVSDGAISRSLPAFDLTVIGVNSAPIVSNSPATSVNQGSTYSYTPSASDPDGDSLTYSISNRPSWASFNSSTGRLSGTPSNANVGTTSGIVITVSDGTASTAVGPFAITVVNVNDAPIITGTPSSSATEGQFYSFTPAGSDLDGDNLTFSISNKPSWMSFNTSTGQLSGTPGSSNAGSTTGLITISVSDGKASAALPSFTITVAAAQPVTRSATLSWNAPTTRTDGSPLSMSELGGYTVRYGTSAGNYTKSVDVSDAYTMQYTFTNLAQGTYYFVVTAYDLQGQSSGNSSSVSAVIN